MLDPYSWFEARRGIRRETFDAWGVEVAGLEVRFPYPGGATKVRVGLEKEDRRFYWEPPSQAGQVPFLPPNFEQGSHMFLFEGESDTLAAWQAAPPEARPHMVGLSGLNAWKSKYAEELFGQAKVVWVVFDNDDPYSPASDQNEKAWASIRAALGRKAKRVRLPQGIKDVADFLATYDFAAFRVLLQGALQPVRHYRSLDLTKPVPPTDWLVQDFLVSGEVTVMAAESGVGKSWLMKQLALAIAGDDSSFLGLSLHKHGRVIFVDEENPAELVMQRLTALGMTPAHMERLDYLWYEGVDLVNEPEKLLEQAMDAEPELIVLDSLSRVALGVDENSNTEMSKLFRGSIVPLARETGAAVVAIHHSPSDNAGRPRGATAIRAAADQVISILAAKDKEGDPTGVLNIFPSKPRRQLTCLQARITGDMERDGVVRVEEITEAAPF